VRASAQVGLDDLAGVGVGVQPPAPGDRAQDEPAPLGRQVALQLDERVGDLGLAAVQDLGERGDRHGLVGDEQDRLQVAPQR
jgi:hypothetical protein